MTFIWNNDEGGIGHRLGHRFVDNARCEGVGTAESKLNAFKVAGVKVVYFPTDIVPLVKQDLGL